VRLKRFVCSLVVMALCGIGSIVASDVQADSAIEKQAANSPAVSNGSKPDVPKARVSKESAAEAPQSASANTTKSSSVKLAAQQPEQNSNTAPKKRNKSKSKPVVNFQKLDSETESVLSEVMNLSGDLAILDEQQNYPPQNQVLVLVTLQPNDFFELDTVELTVDNKIVAAHPYTDKDIAALSKGGGHRLYLSDLPAGKHELLAKLVGKIPRDPDYRQEVTYTFITGVNRTLLELYINNGDNNGYPQITVREWD